MPTSQSSEKTNILKSWEITGRIHLESKDLP